MKITHHYKSIISALAALALFYSAAPRAGILDGGEIQFHGLVTDEAPKWTWQVGSPDQTWAVDTADARTESGQLVFDLRGKGSLPFLEGHLYEVAERGGPGFTPFITFSSNGQPFSVTAGGSTTAQHFRASVPVRNPEKDDPFADEKMYLLEQEFNRGTGRLERLVTELDNILKNVPARISLSEALSVSPVNISVFSRTPVGYRCVWLLVGFDQLALKAFQASHYGLISHAQRDDYLRRGAQSIHRSYGLVLGYRSSGISRRDILQNSSALTEQMTSLDEDILLGKKRSSFSPPVSKESIALLQSVKNARPESMSAPEEPCESRLEVDPQTGTDSLTR